MTLHRAVALVLALSAPAALAACTTDADPSIETGAEQALTEATVLAKGISNPSGLAVAGNHVFFGANRFVASGDPELDQQFAYWEGKFSRVPLAGGRPETVAEIGPINRVRVAGSRLYYGMDAGCWISRLDANGPQTAADRSVYQYDDCEPEVGLGIAGFEITPKNELVVVTTDGDILAGDLDGGAMHTIAEVRFGNSGLVVETQALADGALYIVTPSHLTDAQGQRLPKALFRIALDSGAKTKILDFPGDIRNFVSDGKNLVWSEGGTKVVALAAGSTEAKPIADGFASITDIASDGTSVFVADSKRDAIYAVKDAFAAAPKRQRKLAGAKGLTTMILSGDALYFGTHLVENRKPAGIIGRVAVPQ